MDPASYNAWRLTSLSTLPAWALALASASAQGGSVESEVMRQAL